jgi:CheY-like chemotaxis protein/two-component sensor histidine kinase
MERQVRHMSRLVDELLDVSRIIRGVVRLRRETIELAPILGRVLDVVRPLVQKRRQELIIDLPAESIFLDADPVRMEQVLTNLLNNAAKFTQEGGKVWLTAGREGSDILVRVKDNGIGIPRELLREVFDLFMQVDSSLERSLGGLGIGLTLAKSLVELQGGSIEAHSEGIGQGSEFIVRLPTSSRGVLSREGFASPADIPSRRVLIVDDNADAARTLAILVKHYGHEVQTASDGASALEAAHIFKPVIIFLDIGMPGMNGYELARRLRADPATKEVVLVALTGYGQEEDRRRSLEAGFDDHAIKPVDLERLTQILGTVRS